MKGSRVAKRYARALLELAAEQNQLEAWGAELTRFAEVGASPEIARRLESPELPEVARLEAVSLITERLNLSFPLRSFALVLARHGRINETSAVAASYLELLDERLGRARATLTFAAPASDEEVARVVAALEGISKKHVIATVTTDAALLGGVVAELEGKIYDASLASRLKNAERRLTEQA